MEHGMTALEYSDSTDLGMSSPCDPGGHSARRTLRFLDTVLGSQSMRYQRRRHVDSASDLACNGSWNVSLRVRYMLVSSLLEFRIHSYSAQQVQ